MPWKYSEEYYREYTRTTWNEAVQSWTAIMGKLLPYRQEVVADLAATTGETLLDLGTGTGEPALTLAEGVGRTGSVVGIDLSEKMIERAIDNARQRGVSNASFQVMDCTQLRFPDASFDGAVSAFGFQIFTDPDSAAKETLRVLRPGGRLSLVVWSTGDRVPFLDVVVAPMLKHAEPDETGYIPTPYELGAEGQMVEFLRAIGFREAKERRVTHPIHFRDADDYLTGLLEGTPLGHSLAEETKEVQAEVLRDTRANLTKFTGADGIVLPGEAVVVTAHKGR